MEVTVELDQFKLTAEITRLIDDKPDPSCRDSADDCRGVRELEWHLTFAIAYDDNGKVKECGYLPKWLAYLTREHSDEITAAIWKQHDNRQGDQ